MVFILPLSFKKRWNWKVASWILKSFICSFHCLELMEPVIKQLENTFDALTVAVESRFLWTQGRCWFTRFFIRSFPNEYSIKFTMLPGCEGSQKTPYTILLWRKGGKLKFTGQSLSPVAPLGPTQ